MATRVLGCLLLRISVTLESFFIFVLFVNVALCLCNDALCILDAKRTVEYESRHKCAHASITNTYEEGAPLFFPILVRSSSAALYIPLWETKKKKDKHPSDLAKSILWKHKHPQHGKSLNIKNKGCRMHQWWALNDLSHCTAVFSLNCMILWANEIEL